MMYIMSATEKRTQIYLTAEQHAAVQRLARQQGLSMAGVVREAIEAYVTTRRGGLPTTSDPLEDLAGIFEGPGDLSERHDDYLDGGPGSRAKAPAKRGARRGR